MGSQLHPSGRLGSQGHVREPLSVPCALRQDDLAVPLGSSVREQLAIGKQEVAAVCGSCPRVHAASVRHVRSVKGSAVPARIRTAIPGERGSVLPVL